MPLIARLAADGVRRVSPDGGIAIREGLEQDLVDDMTIAVAPVTLGAGRPLFGGKVHTVHWTLASVRQNPSGLLQMSSECNRGRS